MSVRVAEVCSEVATFNVDECDVTDTSALVKGNAKVEKGTFTEYGFVWGVSEDALTTTVSGSDVSAMTSDGDFEAAIKGLPACGDTVWFAAYAKSSQCKDLIYGDTMMFVVCGRGQDAKPCLFTPTVKDHEGNVYNTVQIGTQCWMKENMRCKTSPKGYLTKGDTSSYSAAHYYDNTASTIPLKERGLFYNWAGVLDTILTEPTMASFINRRGICPEGWHVPSEKDWSIMEEYIDSLYQCTDTVYEEGSLYANTPKVAKSLAYTKYWQESNQLCTPGKNLDDNNTTGFSAIPVGYWEGLYYNNFIQENSSTKFHSSTSFLGTFGTKGSSYISITYGTSFLHQTYGTYRSCGWSVRCVRDDCDFNSDECVTVTETRPARMEGDSVVFIGRSFYIAGEVEDYGFVWGESKDVVNKVINISNGARPSSFNFSPVYIASVKNITPCDTVWYVAFLKSSDCSEISYGDTLFFRVPAPDTISCGTVIDIDDNRYTTVKIGNQCWMAENMRATTSPKTGHNIPTNSRSRLSPYFYEITSPTFTLNETGVLYNWAAAMDTSFTADAKETLDNRKGICPEGWHVPSQADWNTLISTVNADADCNVCGTGINNIAKALASTEGWETVDVECQVGNDQESNNSTGFTTIPTGYRNVSISGEGKHARFWSSTNHSTSAETVYGMMLNNNQPNVSVNSGYDKNLGLSVRCVKDN